MEKPKLLKLPPTRPPVKYVVHPGVKRVDGVLYFYKYREVITLRGLPFSDCVPSGDRTRPRHLAKHIYP